MTDIDIELYETDANGEVVKNKDGSPRKRRGGRRKAEDATPDVILQDEAAVEEFLAEAADDEEPAEPEEPVNIELKTMQGGVIRTINETLEHEFLARVQGEIDTVFEKYGEQNRPHISHPFDRFEYENRELEFKRRYAWQDENGGPTWDTIVLEECFEAFAAVSDEDRYAELVQLAAMATLAATSLKRAAQ